MTRYIDAEELKRMKFHPLPYPHIIPTDCEPESYERGWNDAIDAVVDNEPTADVRENIKGEWLDCEVVHDRKDAKITDWQQARCSICGKWHTTPYMYSWYHFEYCPNCGTQMIIGES